MNKLVWRTLLGGALALGVAQAASAQSATALVQRSGNAFHVAACPGPAAAGNARCHAHIVSDEKGNPKFRTDTTGGTPSGYGPADLKAAYNLTGQDNTGTIVIIDAYGYSAAEADLATYRSTFGLPACTSGGANPCFTKLNQRGVAGGYPKDNTGWAQETALDLDMASAMCPSCKLVLVEADSASFANLAAAENTAANIAGAVAISNSYGGGENGSSGYESAYNHPGIAITVSSGDSGYGVEFPASSPHVTAVGGTTLKRASNARGWSETTWNGSGSGCSAVYAKPPWQSDSCKNRTVADVSAVADPNTGVAVYGPVFGPFHGWMVFGGTSVAAPLTAGVYALHGGASNYGADPYSNTAFLNDITSGSNGNCGGSYLCTAGPGYDGPTGLGTPNGSKAY